MGLVYLGIQDFSKQFWEQSGEKQGQEWKNANSSFPAPSPSATNIMFRADVAEYGFNRQSDCNPKCSDSTSKDRIVKKYIVSWKYWQVYGMLP